MLAVLDTSVINGIEDDTNINKNDSILTNVIFLLTSNNFDDFQDVLGIVLEFLEYCVVKG